MTIDDFFEKLPRDGWMLADRRHVNSIYSANCIRRADNDCVCPRLYVAPWWAGYGPSVEDIRYSGWGPIQNAADGVQGHDPALRARLLAHCNLTEKGQP